jgi:gliding motility-associated lipoprotein GldB
MQKFILFLCSLALLGCDNRSVVEDDILKIPVAVSVIRFDKAFASATVEELPSLKETFPMFFSTRIPDSVWVQRLQDPLQQEMAVEILKIFPDETLLAEKLGPLFQHIKYYFPRFKVPTTVTLINDVDYKNRVLVASDTLLILSLDNYLGADHRYYSDTKKYIVKNLKADQLESDIAKAYAQLYVPPPSKNTFLEHIIYFGKQLYLQDVWLPNVSDASKIGYTELEWQWVQDNELDMWRYFVEKELLFSTDPGLTPRFISNAPFSKFYLELDNESPGMAGRYLGWQIVRSFVENNTITPQQLLVFDAEALFKKSNYKPKK